MNLFGLFGKKKPVQKIDINSTIQKLRETQELLDKREAHLTRECEKYREEAKKFVKENKTKALYFLKKAKMTESHLEKTFNTKFNLEQQIFMLCEASINKETIDAMKTARDAMKLNEKEINIDKITDIMDDVTESIDNVEEVSSIISTPVGAITSDDDLIQELNNLETEVNQEDILQEQNLSKPVLKISSFPKVPLKEPNTKTEDEELEELKKLML